jgi:hypothetical protein
VQRIPPLFWRSFCHYDADLQQNQSAIEEFYGRETILGDFYPFFRFFFSGSACWALHKPRSMVMGIALKIPWQGLLADLADLQGGRERLCLQLEAARMGDE